MSRLLPLLLIALLGLLPQARAQGTALQLLNGEVQRGLALALQEQRQANTPQAGCRALAELLAVYRFGPEEQGRLRLLVDAAALAELGRSGQRVAAAELPQACGWRFLAATLPQAAIDAIEVAETLQPSAPRDFRPYAEIATTLVLLLLALPALLLWRRVRRQPAPPDFAPITLPPPTEAGAPDAGLQRLLQERAALLAEMQAAGAEVAEELRRLQRLRGAAPPA